MTAAASLAIPPRVVDPAQPGAPGVNHRFLRRGTVLRALGVLAAVALTSGSMLFGDRLLVVERFGIPGIFLLSLVSNVSVLLPGPAIATTFAAGSVFNPVLVGVVAAAGATLGELSGYVAGWTGRGIVARHAIHRRIEDWMWRRGTLTLFALAAVPNPCFDLAGMTAGLARIPVWRFLAITWIGKCVKFLLIAAAGAGLLSRF